MLVVGGIAAAVAAFLAGTSGFGFALLATPLLLLLGFSLPFVVTVNLLISLATRISVAYRLRAAIDRRRAALLVAGAVPGLYLGARALASLDRHLVKVAAGGLVAVAAAALLAAERRPPARGPRWVPIVAGFAGGFLGTTTALIGVPAALLLARQRLAAASFFADMAVYQLAAAGIGLALIAATGGFGHRSLPAFGLWLPGVLAGNALGTTLGLRLSERAFRLVTLSLALVAGIATAVTA